MTGPEFHQIPPAEPPTPGRRINPRLVIAALLLVLAVVFVFQNTDKVKIRFLIPQVTAPLWVALLITLVVGAIAGMLGSAAYRRRRRRDEHGN